MGWMMSADYKGGQTCEDDNCWCYLYLPKGLVVTISREDVVDEDRRQLEEVEGGRKAAGT